MTADRLDAVAVSDLVRDTYLRYLRTLLPLSDAAIEAALHRELASVSALVTGPLLEANPPYAPGASLRQLIAGGVLSPWLERLDHDRGIPLDRPLYRHQEDAIRRAVTGRNLVVATGTGSGKTESFLLPILHGLAQEAAAGTLSQPGGRALLLYPMNALANDQLKRLRDVLAAYPEVTFGRYTGETLTDPGRARERFTSQFPGVAVPPNELLSREEMQQAPPHLLLTNYAMLEYLLLRPSDHALFDGDTATRWRFVVMDEAHVYDGASGIEVAMLLRRLTDRVARDRALQFIATSATVGGQSAGPAVADFAETLFGAPFSYGDSPAERDVVWAVRRDLPEVDPWGPLRPEAYRRLLDAADPLAALRAEGGVPAGDDVAALLASERRVRQAQELLGAGPRPLHEVAGELFGDDAQATEHTADLVALGARVHDHLGAPLIAARYHLWARATEGAFTCLHQSGPHAHLTRHEVCATCRSAVFEVGSCKRCAATYLVGTRSRSGTTEVLSPPREFGKPLSWYVLLDESAAGADAAAQVDEDDATLEGLDDDAPVDHIRRRLCVACGTLLAADATVCTCGGATRVVLEVDKTVAALKSCGLCGGRSNAGQIRRLESGTDAAVSVLSTAVYQSLPPDPDPDMAEKPGGGRKLLLFADSRQDAAYFAPYLEDSYDALVRRRIVHEALLAVADPDEDPRLDDVADRAVKVGEGFGMFDWRERRAAKQAKARTWVHAELLSVSASISLEGLGLVAFGLLRPPGLVMPAPLTSLGLTDGEAWALVCELLRSLRGQGAVSFPDGVAVDADEFQPRTGPIVVRLEGPEARRKVLSWLPGRGANTRTDYLRRLGAALGVELDVAAVMQGLWRWLSSEPASELLRQFNDPVKGAVRQLDHELITMRPVDAQRPVFRCRRCQRLSPVSVRDVCPTLGCAGRLESWSPPEAAGDDNHYRSLARGLNAVPLRVSEHTAQFTPDEAARIQQEFLNGDVNALSCSTTFELGVDVGELQSVVLRNVPPTTSNYVQRAGRAGRRTDAAALIVTYAQRRSHDLTYFRDPARMIAGTVRPPRVSLRNDRIARRHAQAVALAAYFREAMDTRGVGYSTSANLFGDAGEDALLVDWLHALPQPVMDGIRRVVPADLHQRVGLDDGSFVDHFVDLLKVLGDKHRLDVESYRRLEADAGKEGNYRRAEVYKRVINTLERRYLLSELSSHNVLPKYGFPVDTVEMRTSHIGTVEAARLALDRDLRLAISDYAPGTQTVAGGYLWESGGVYRFPDREFPHRYYAACVCGWYEEQLAPFEVEQCGSCHRKGAAAPKIRRYLVPEFGFVAKRDTPKRPSSRPRRMYASTVHLVSDSFATDPEHLALADSAVLAHRYAERGELVVINAGINNTGYRICQWCGAGEPARPGQHAASDHEHPLTGRHCRGPWEWVSLGHRFESDVLELKFQGAAVPTTADVWWGLLYAIVEAAAERLQIARDDIDGTLHFGGGAPTLVLYDDVPAGAGHVRRIRDELEPVLQDALRRVSDCECGPETSCYRCLRSFRNQRLHEQLRRGAVADLLSMMLLGGPADLGDDAEYEAVQAADLLAYDGRHVVVSVNGTEMRGQLWVEDEGGRITSVLLQNDDAVQELAPEDVVVQRVRRV